MITLRRAIANASEECIAHFYASVRGHPHRRHLPGGQRRSGRIDAGRGYALAALRAVIALVRLRSCSAELVLMIFPALFLRKGPRITEQIQEFANGVSAAPPPRNVSTPLQAQQAWVRAVEATLLTSTTKLTQLVETGALSESCPADPRQFFPDVLQYPGQEELAIKRPPEEPLFDSKFARRWASSHRHASGGSSGWAPNILAQIAHADPNIMDDIAELWARPRSLWLSTLAFRVATRECDGWLIRKNADTPDLRPIVAPHTVRRMRSAALAQKARAAVQAFCEPRRQWGLSNDDLHLVYSLSAQLIVRSGGSAVLADRSMSYQLFNRGPVIDSIAAAIALTSANLPKEAAALATLAHECFLAGSTTPPTTVTFAQIRIPVPALPQGCSASAALEAITIARHTPQPTRGIIQLTAHDDLVAAGHDLDEYTLPDTSICGGRYNTAKAVALGPAAPNLVARGMADRTATASKIWGRPIGDTLEWYDTVWRPRFDRRLAGIRRLANTDMDVAIRALAKIGGPATMAAHWLRGLPEADLAPFAERFRDLDEEWTRLWITLGGTDPTSLTKPLMDGARAALADLWPHASVTRNAPYHSASGMHRAWRQLLKLAAERDIDPRPWGALLSLPTLAKAPSRILSAQLVEECEAVLATRKRLRCQRRSTPHAMNLWAEALRPWNELHHVIPRRFTRQPVLPHAVARVLHLPILPTVGAQVTGVCPLCDALPNNSGGPQRTGVEKIMDDAFHPLVCPKIWGRYHMKHNQLVATYAAMARELGLHAEYFDLPLADGKRPGDWIENCADAKHLAVLCDLTIHNGGRSGAREAAEDKRQKYSRTLHENPELKLEVVALSASGDIAGETSETIGRWTKALAKLRRDEGLRPGSPDMEVRTAFAFAFAAIMGTQMHIYAKKAKLAILMTARPPERPEPPAQPNPLPNRAFLMATWEQQRNQNEVQPVPPELSNSIRNTLTTKRSSTTDTNTVASRGDGL